MSGDDDGLSSDHRLVARRWLLIAQRDVRSAVACLDAGEPILETAAYLCQQAAEKLMKGLLVLGRTPFRKTHDLEALRDLVVGRFPAFTAMIDRLVPLTDWGHIFRYPDLDEEPVPTNEELRHFVWEIEQFAEHVARTIDTSE